MVINSLAGIRPAPRSNGPMSSVAVPSQAHLDGFVKGAAPLPPGLIPRAAAKRDDAPTLEEILNGQPETTHTRQLADSYGRVTHLALQLSPYVGGDDRTQLLGAYKTLFTEMEPDTKFTVVVQTNADQADVQQIIKDNNVPDPERITFLNPNVGDLTVWARDQMVGLYTPDDPTHTALLHQTTLHSWHANDMQVPARIAAADPSIILDTEPFIVTDGGDVQSNTKEAFAGYYSIVSTEMKMYDQMTQDATLKGKLFDYYQSRTGNHVVEPDGDVHFPYKKIDLGGGVYRLDHDPDFHPLDLGPGKVTEQQMLEDLAVQLFSDRFDKPVTIMGKDNPATPDHIEEPATDHMDMGCTPIDDQTFMVGDPRLAQTLFASMSAEERTQAEAVLSKLNGREIKLDDFGSHARGKFGPHNRNNPADFDEYARLLTSKGYNVARVPHAEPAEDGKPYISYNNCLMERFEKDGQQIRRVFLPQYGIPKLDDYANQVWQSQGFEVHPIPLAALSAEWGALRCTTNWLDRDPRG